MARIIPVIDVMGGVVVHAVGGRREEYQPIESKLTRSTAPVDVAKVLIEASGAEDLYVADLDAICGRWVVASPVLNLLHRLQCRTFLDAGGQKDLHHLPHVRQVVPLETMVSIRGAFDAARGFGFSDKLTFSIDLFNGRLPSHWEDTQARTPLQVAERVAHLGYRTLIVIDLGRVGVGNGPGTEQVCAAIRTALPDVELIAGGGISNWDDVRRLDDAGADAVLVASALHDGTLTFPRPAS